MGDSNTQLDLIQVILTLSPSDRTMWKSDLKQTHLRIKYSQLPCLSWEFNLKNTQQIELVQYGALELCATDCQCGSDSLFTALYLATEHFQLDSKESRQTWATGDMEDRNQGALRNMTSEGGGKIKQCVERRWSGVMWLHESWLASCPWISKSLSWQLTMYHRI